MGHLKNRLLLALFLASVGWSSVMIATSPSCTHQLTVEEAEAGLSASCVLLARAMTTDHPEALDAALDRVCEPGRTRAFLARVIAEQLSKNPGGNTEWLDLPPQEVVTEDPFGSTGDAPAPSLKDAGH